MKRFEHKVVLVTGAASGIGQASVFRIAEEGGKVICVDVVEKALQKTVHQIREKGGDAIALVCDVSDHASVRATVAKGIEHYGRLDALCNIAGILRFDNTLDLNMEDFDEIIAVNLRGTFMMCQATLPYLIETRGSIVNMASSAALGAHAWTAAYSASKGGVLALTKCLAIEFGRLGVNSNAICPAAVDTPINARFTLPEGADSSLLDKIKPFDGVFRPPSVVASAVAFLASDDAVHINGDYIRTDGGVLT